MAPDRGSQSYLPSLLSEAIGLISAVGYYILCELKPTGFLNFNPFAMAWIIFLPGTAAVVLGVVGIVRAPSWFAYLMSIIGILTGGVLALLGGLAITAMIFMSDFH